MEPRHYLQIIITYKIIFGLLWSLSQDDLGPVHSQYYELIVDIYQALSLGQGVHTYKSHNFINN